MVRVDYWTRGYFELEPVHPDLTSPAASVSFPLMTILPRQARTANSSARAAPHQDCLPSRPACQIMNLPHRPVERSLINPTTIRSGQGAVWCSRLCISSDTPAPHAALPQGTAACHQTTNLESRHHPGHRGQQTRGGRPPDLAVETIVGPRRWSPADRALCPGGFQFGPASAPGNNGTVLPRTQTEF
jgi:hypothetical protein